MNTTTSISPSSPTMSSQVLDNREPLKKIKFCSVFPKIGISRLGDSKEYFIGPEAPGVFQKTGFKDDAGGVKRQAARFRVYGFDEEGNVVAELTADNTQAINWKVSTANKKASWHQFAGTQATLKLFESQEHEAEHSHENAPPLRNKDWPGDRTDLIIEASGAIGGRNQVSSALEGVIFDLPDPVYLGELRTDDLGRLVFLGGHGHSQPLAEDDQYLIHHYANNDGWHDDTSDSVIDVEVISSEGISIPVKGRARVVVAPPDFAPHTDNLVTLYDVMEEVALDYDLAWHLASSAPPKLRSNVSFVDDIYPILDRIVGYQWVNERALRGHGPGKRGNFLSDDVLALLCNENNIEASELRKNIFGHVRNPNLKGADADSQANYYQMPQLSGNEGDTIMGQADTWLTVTKRQYEALELWSQGKFSGFTSLKELKAALEQAQSAQVPLEELTLQEQPFALTKAALNSCVGGPFFPGIEMTSISTSPHLYQAAFEVSDKLEAGDITKWMALPWQADFYECNTHWWPAQRPDDVVSEYDYFEVVKDFPLETNTQTVEMLLFPRKAWARGIGVERTLRPVFEWPEPDDSESVESYAVTCQKAFSEFAYNQWTNQGRGWPLPMPKPTETLGRYKFRLREYFDHYGSNNHWPFTLPASSAHTPLAHYREQVIQALTKFMDSVVPSPQTNETIDQYAQRLDEGDSIWGGLLAATTQVGYEFRQNYQGDNEMVYKWKELGFVTRVPDIKERILVETGRGKYDGLKDRDYFYIMLNWEDFPDFAPKAKELAHKFLDAARKIQKTPQFKTNPDNSVYEFFEYSPTAFEARMQEIYERLAAQATAPADDWKPADLINRVRQMAPFNQLDGVWLRYATNAGPISDVNSLLFEIWSDETGNGDPSLNHSNLYTSFLQSLGIYMPDVRSRDYADNTAILDSAYTNPLFELVISQFSQEFFPEILGMTMQLEWEVLSLWPGVKRLEAKNLSAQFYRMHIGIDNAVEGHGAKAKEAVKQYLDYVRKESGQDEVARQWERIWTGYAAFATTGDVSEDLTNQRDYPPTMLDQMTQLIQNKKYFAQRNHSNLPLFGTNRMNDWFEEPLGFLDMLANSRYITPGDPDNSYLINDRTTYSGPMYKIFTANELKLWADWIRWLGKEYEPSETPVIEPVTLMQQLVERLASVAANVPAHSTAPLQGTLNGQKVTKSVGSWFLAGPSAFMEAFSSPENDWVVPYSAASSKYITQLLPGAPAMEIAIASTIIAGVDGVTIIKNWIDAGCPLPSSPSRGPEETWTGLLAEGEERVSPRAEAPTSAIFEMPRTPPQATKPSQKTRRRTPHRKQIFGQDAVH